MITITRQLTMKINAYAIEKNKVPKFMNPDCAYPVVGYSVQPKTIQSKSDDPWGEAGESKVVEDVQSFLYIDDNGRLSWVYASYVDIRIDKGANTDGKKTANGPARPANGQENTDLPY